MYGITVVLGIAVVLSGCSVFSNRLPKPKDLPAYASHHYVVKATGTSGEPVPGVRLAITTTDLAAHMHDDGPRKRSDEITTDAAGMARVTVDTSMEQHFKGGYYSPANEPELNRQKFPHGGKDIWGYFSEFRLMTPRGERVYSTFTEGPASGKVVEIPLSIPTPGNFGKPGKHSYEFRAFDKYGNIVPDVRVQGIISDYAQSKGERKISQSKGIPVDCTTDTSGICRAEVSVIMTVHYIGDFPGPVRNQLNKLIPLEGTQAHFGYISGAEVVGAIGGFLTSPTVQFFQGSGEANGQQLSFKLVVPTPQDYYCDELKEPSQVQLALRLNGWVRLIKVSSDSRHAELEKICQVSFKSKTYVSLSLQHRTQFNELKLNNYGIGILVFDEVVRKMLAPIDSASSGLSVDGYRIAVRTQKSNFIEKASPTEFLIYEFFLPRDLVRKYRQADISGQSLINGSIVLLDGERIDLELR